MTLSFCSNIFPGANWAETQRHLSHSLPRLQRELERETKLEQSIGLDLWLSAKTAAQLHQSPQQLHALKDLLAQSELCCEMMNAFPYGEFHGKRVKERVYQPDWSDLRRVDYTKQCFLLLHELAASGQEISVSTLPGSHKSFHPRWWQEHSAEGEQLLVNLRNMAFWLENQAQVWQRDLHLGLEPEPFGLFENLQETIRFFERLLDSCSEQEQEILLRRLGINFDSCHFALQFEQALPTLTALHEAGIRISKLHLSNALELEPSNQAALSLLREFDEPTYLHQVIAQFADGSLRRSPDLPEALADEKLQQALLWRVHFHLPLHFQAQSLLSSTQGHLRETLRWWQENPHLCRHAAIETYTWAVMPEAVQAGGLEQMLAKEFAFVMRHLGDMRQKNWPPPQS